MADPTPCTCPIDDCPRVSECYRDVKHGVERERHAVVAFLHTQAVHHAGTGDFDTAAHVRRLANLINVGHHGGEKPSPPDSDAGRRSAEDWIQP